MKKLYFYVLWLFLNFISIINYTIATSPTVVCSWLPWCEWWDMLWWEKVSDKGFFSFLWKIISETILYVWAIAIISLIIAWIYYMISLWEDEKTEKAKKWIIWSLVWVLVSTSAWFIINMLNNFKINY